MASSKAETWELRDTLRRGMISLLFFGRFYSLSLTLHPTLQKVKKTGQRKGPGEPNRQRRVRRRVGSGCRSYTEARKLDFSGTSLAPLRCQIS